MNTKKWIVLSAMLIVGVMLLTACKLAGTGQRAELTPTPVAETPAVSTLPEPAMMTMTMVGAITEVRDDGIRVTATDTANTENDVVARFSADTLIVDTQTGGITDGAGVLTEGATIAATISGVMTRSMPPQANAYMIAVNLADNAASQPHYVIADEVTANEDGSVTVLHQNRDLYMKLPADLTVDTMGKDGAAAAAPANLTELKKGDVLLVWFDIVAESFPAQATATRAVLITE